jgi:hypothetical protein
MKSTPFCVNLRVGNDQITASDENFKLWLDIVENKNLEHQKKNR